ncbi:hypothetical protein SAMN05660477_00691 [Soonwooa buanensis]|uniref:DUF1684 domain-containing protein n=1 Tax=Soonwooa buanensis TaxID=619805 RepID=A0A1T5DG52_9FLAO|nr:DUF1684 domain-containing protein [Soonwooa buanensis]SKB70551.1 hypothetical protein SAMN05660477_00691 [Soonwooa buanensis]
MKYFLLLLTLFGFLNINGQSAKDWKQDVLDFQKELNREYKTEGESPLRGDNFTKFTEHPFFPISKKYKVIARLEKSTSDQKLIMPTSSGKSKSFTEYGKAYFKLNGKDLVVTLYTNDALQTNPEYINHVFLPFGDLTNSNQTYGGGRYIDLEKTDKNTIVIDFNKAYQPYCAYNAFDYSCPLIPTENILDVAIKAGVKYNDVYHH